MTRETAFVEHSRRPVDEVLIGSDGPELLEGRGIRLPLPCKHCGYDLQGLAATGVCPECGTPAPRSLEAAIDPTTHRLPPLMAPASVGNAVLALGGVILLATTGLVMFQIMSLDWTMNHLPGLVRLAVPLGITISLVSGLLGFWPIMKLWPTPGTVDPRDGRRGLGVLSLGLIIWILGCALVWWFNAEASNSRILLMLIPLLGGLLSLEGFRKILIQVGARSRLFRTDRIRRQRVRDLMFGIGFVMVGIVVIWLGGNATSGGPSAWWMLGRFNIGGAQQSGLAFLGLAMTVVAIVLLFIGLLYLCMNMAWIRRSLIAPPPRLREYLDPPSGS